MRIFIEEQYNEDGNYRYTASIAPENIRSLVMIVAGDDYSANHALDKLRRGLVELRLTDKPDEVAVLDPYELLKEEE